MSLVATDLDGTFVRTDGTVSTRTVAALGACRRAGVPVVIVTGRPPVWARRIARPIGFDGTMICCNGAVTLDLAENRVVRTDPIAPDRVCELVRRLATAMPEAGFAVETVDRVRFLPGYERLAGMPDDVAEPVDDLATLVAEPVAKLRVRHRRLDGDALLDAVTDVVGTRAMASHSTTTRLVEITAAGVDKASALARLCARLGVDRRGVIAFGDSLNDRSMLRWAGTSVAVANAHPAVLAAATTRTASSDNDGVAQILESYLATSQVNIQEGDDRDDRAQA